VAHPWGLVFQGCGLCLTLFPVPIQTDSLFTLSLDRPFSVISGRFRPGRKGLSHSIQTTYK